MADLDRDSSPDPLLEDLPPSSVVRTISRSAAKVARRSYDRSSLSKSVSSAARSSSIQRASSPRKQMFELDVGKDGSPQRLFVTVEAEDDMHSGSVKRRLWLPSSPSRNVSTEETLTRMVPLRGLTDDEGDGNTFRNPTPKPRRGRPRSGSNGTPMPKKKRNGTPLQRSEKTSRRKTNLSSEVAIPSSEAAGEPDWDAAGATPKPARKPRKSKSPQKAPTPAVPSSQPTGRKRGRPRKAMIPEEFTALVEPEDKVDLAMSENGLIDEVLPSLEADVLIGTGEQPENHVDPPENHATGVMESSATPTPVERNNSRINETMDEIMEEVMDDDNGYENEPLMSPQGASPEADRGADQSEFPAAGPQSDALSDFEGVAHPSEFSEIGFETLPSFQASFQGKASGMSTAPAVVDETSPILNQTLASLRQSTRNGEQSPVPTARGDKAPEDRFDPSSPHSRGSDGNVPSSPDGESSAGRMSRKPRRSLPLSRQIFAAKSSPYPSSHHDDSFSSIPEDILEAATPRRPRAQAIPETTQNEEDGGYDDSFSEIPDDVLEAATPGRAAGMKITIDQHTAPSSPAVRQQGLHAGDNTSSSRLPTPENTSSSNRGSKKDQGGLLQVPTGPVFGSSSSRRDIPSSPPDIARSYNHDINTSDIPQNPNETPEGQDSSPQLPLSAVAASERDRSAEPHVPSRRPTLSPIVRVARTLQNVMSDRSSPADRESSLGSPFRGSVVNDRGDSRQSSIAKSPTEGRNDAAAFQNGLASFNPIASFTKSIASSFRQSQGQTQPERSTAGNATYHFGSNRQDDDHEQQGSLARSMHISSRRNSKADDGHNAGSNMTRSRDVRFSNDPMSWVAEGSPQHTGAEAQAPAQSVNGRASGLSATQGSHADTNSPRDDEPAQQNTQDEDTQLQMQLEEEGQHGDEQDQDDDGLDAAEDFMDDGADEAGQDEPGNEPMVNDINDMASEGDLWDIEASRPDTSAISDAKPSENIDPQRERTSSPWRRNGRRLIYQDRVTSPTQIDIDDLLPSEAEEEVLSSSRQQESSLSPSRRSERTLEARRQAKSKSPAIQDLPAGEDIEDNFDDGYDDGVDDDVDDDVGEGADDGDVQDMDDDDLDQYSQVPTSHAKPKEPSMNEEYSMLQSAKPQDTPAAEKKKPGFFSGFDIMSFFSSPATLPKENTATASRDSTKRLSQIKFSNPVSSVNQPQQRTMYSTGMFPSVPQRQFQPSPERRKDLFSPGTSLRSGGTVADTYAATSSPRFSTPERHEFPSVEQKRNFTPRPGQSTGTLFNSSRPSTPGQPTIDRLQVQRDDPESSMMTEESEYERVPPREKPSQWDKTLSPSKSCFRSPLKPSTPGRVVAFSNNTKASTLPGVQDRGAAGQQINGGGVIPATTHNAIPQIPIVQPQQRQQQQQQQRPASSDKENRIIPPPSTTTTTTTMEERFSNQRRGAGPSGPGPRPVTFLSPNKQLQHPSHRLSPAPPSLRSPSQNNLTSNLSSRGANNTNINNNNNNNSSTTSDQQQHQKATHESPAAAASSRPATTNTNTNTTTTAPSSSNKWTKTHWLHLSHLTDLRRHEPPSSFPFSSSSSTSSPLLGLELTSQGEKMSIQPWHLDIVEAFLSSSSSSSSSFPSQEPLPFDEKYIIKRLFAILAKEERDERRRRRREMMTMRRGSKTKPSSNEMIGIGRRNYGEGGTVISSDATVSIPSERA